MDTTYYDHLETRDPQQRELALLAALQETINHAQSVSPYWSKSLADISATDIDSLQSLSSLPILTKTDLIDMQDAEPPYGGLFDTRQHTANRVFFSPGPIIEPQPSDSGDPWRVARALYAAGFRPGDIVANCFSYHLTPAGHVFDFAVDHLGCTVFPAGVGNVDTLAQAFKHLNVNGYVGTPDFLQTILEKAVELGNPVNTMRKACVTGGPLFPQTREWYASHNIQVRQCYATAELGLIAYETNKPEDGMILAEDCIVEIVRPGTGTPVAEGEVGEVVVTTFHNKYPLIRFATGDLSAFMPGTSSCGRTNGRIRGWLGRADQTTKVRGMFVHPRQVAKVVDQFSVIEKARMEVSEIDGRDQFTLVCESSDHSDRLSRRVEEAIRSVCRLRGEVRFVPPQSLPNDGKVIDDKRAIGI